MTKRVWDIFCETFYSPTMPSVVYAYRLTKIKAESEGIAKIPSLSTFKKELKKHQESSLIEKLKRFGVPDKVVVDDGRTHHRSFGKLRSDIAEMCNVLKSNEPVKPEPIANKFKDIKKG